MYVFVTGKLAARALEREVAGILPPGGYEIKVLDRRVAALMSTEYIARCLAQSVWPARPEVVVIPGRCAGPLEPIQGATGSRVLRGPDDLKDLAVFWREEMGLEGRDHPGEDARPPRRPQILAEIVDAAGLGREEILCRALYYRESGADIIDLGCFADRPFPGLGKVIRALKDEGFRVSVDGCRSEDLLEASEAGADLLLSLSLRHLPLIPELSCPAVVIPEEEDDLASLYRVIEAMERWGRTYVIDPILQPPGLGLARSLERYLRLRHEFPDKPFLMGLGNVTELVDADSIGINALLVGIASELEIDYVLTTEVSARAVGAVREVALARRLMHRARTLGRLPKHVDYGLLVLKEPRREVFGEEELTEMQALVRDRHYRIFVGAESIYVFNRSVFVRGRRAEELFEALDVSDPGHAFYLGRELERAETALRLGKKYVQDCPLRWGYLDERDGRGRSS